MSEEKHGFVETIRKLLPFTSVAVILAAIYVGWVFYARWSATRDAERAQAAARTADAQKVLEAYGGNRAKVLSFTATPGIVGRGQNTQLCYGVSNAKTLKIEPPVGEIWPSMYRCLDVPVKKDTTYTITAEDAEGHSDTQSLTVRVQ